MDNMVETQLGQIVDYIIKQGTKNTTTGNWHVEYDELSDAFDFATPEYLRQHHENICDEIDRRKEILSETWTDYDGMGQPDGFDCNFVLACCPYAE